MFMVFESRSRIEAYVASERLKDSGPPPLRVRVHSKNQGDSVMKVMGSFIRCVLRV